MLFVYWVKWFSVIRRSVSCESDLSWLTSPVTGFSLLIHIPQQPWRLSLWLGVLVTRTRTAHHLRERSPVRLSLECRSVSWRSASTDKNTWPALNEQLWPKLWRWQMLRSKPGFKTAGPNGGETEKESEIYSNIRGRNVEKNGWKTQVWSDMRNKGIKMPVSLDNIYQCLGIYRLNTLVSVMTWNHFSDLTYKRP